MARIIGPAAGNAMLNGTTGDDEIIAAGAHNTIYGNGGNDVISGGRYGYATIIVGTELDGLTGVFDTVRMSGPGNSLTGGDETFTVTCFGDTAAITLGNGDNNITAYGSANTITVGIGTNTVNAGPGSSILIRSPDSGVLNVTFADTLLLRGTGNTVTVNAYGQKYPLSGTVDIYGGTGSSTFDLNWSSGTLVTSGRDNVVTAGTGINDITAGSGGDTVHLTGIYSEAGEATIHLAGDHNLVDGVSAATTITGGTDFNTISLGAAFANFDGPLAVKLGGIHNTVSISGFSGTVDAGSSQDIVQLSLSTVTASFHGSGNMVFISGGAVTIEDQSYGLKINIAQDAGTTTINHFGYNRASVVDLIGSGFTSAAQAAAAVHSDGAGGSMLDGANLDGSLHFVGVTHLTAANFRIG